ncbi:anillin-like [Anabrus simplex]|uniref:anillin-like n=1 Tax=Anabrus simplex TaxID=316456 RepID=UPI0035A2DBFC
MDPSTQRMLERARARRQKLDSQLSNVGHDVAKKRYPLQETQTQSLKVTTEVEVTLRKPQVMAEVSISPTKVVYGGQELKEKEAEPSDKKNSELCDEKENTESDSIRDGVRSQLRRLGELYSDTQISSPIHRTELKFACEDKQEVKHGKPAVRVARFQALAQSINQWEDDLSHPQLPRSGEITSPEQRNKTNSDFTTSLKTGNATRNTSVPTEVEESVKISEQTKPLGNKNAPKKVVWDRAILECLEAQGFSRTVSNSRLVYDYSKNSSQDKEEATSSSTENSSVPTKVTSLKEEVEPSSPKKYLPQNTECSKRTGSPVMGTTGLRSSSSHLASVDVQASRKGDSQWKHVPHMGIRSATSPQKFNAHGSPKSGSVLNKASLFETSPTKRSGKDPAELSVSERLALFERNKGQALLPKAPFSMPVPARCLGNVSPNKKPVINKSPERGRLPERSFVGGIRGYLSTSPTKQEPVKESPKTQNTAPNVVMAHRKLFESGTVASHDRSVNHNLQLERQKDMELLLNRWNKNKQISSEEGRKEVPDLTNACKEQEATSSFQVRAKESKAPPPPPFPQLSVDISPTKKSSSAVNQQMKLQCNLQPASKPVVQIETLSPRSPVQSGCSQAKTSNYGNKPNMKQESEPTTPKYSSLCNIKKIKVSPPKPGRLYPCLSDIEGTTTETESEMPEEEERYSSSSEEMDSSSNMDSSFGRDILHAAGIHKSPRNEKSDSDSDMSESAVLDDIDDFLDEALGENSCSESEGPTPPKKKRDASKSPQKSHRSPLKKESPTTTQSQSFRYTRGKSASPSKPIPTHVIEGDQQVPLMHTVSFYRRQQNMSTKGTPVRQVTRNPEVNSQPPDESSANTEIAVRHKISSLLDEVSKQQNVISQVSQALNLCSATVEFSGSAEEVEGERLLLLATHKRQAALHEIQRLKVEGTLKPITEVGDAVDVAERGTLTLCDITLPLKKEFVRHMAADDTCYHFVCLVRSQEQVLITPVLAATTGNLRHGQSIVWNAPLQLFNLYNDFKVTLEVYSIQTDKEILPHDIKYHIGNKKDGNKLRLTPKKLLKQDSRLMMPTVQSPAGPSAVRSPSFHLAGYVVFSLREISRTHFTLNKVAYTSPLEGSIQLRMSSELSVDVTQKGFLTMFEDVSGFGAWHRRWCVLKGSFLAFWKYPDDEKRKASMGQIDLNLCTTEIVGLVSRDICARPNTFLLETTRPAQPEDEESLVLVRMNDRTMIRHLLSADTREDRLQWCTQINKALCMLRAWSNKPRQ